MNLRRDKRVKRRFPCELNAGGHAYRGIIRNLSHDGMFVQTEATIAPGTELDLILAGTGAVPRLELRAIVVRRRAVPAILANALPRGLGLRLLRAPVEYGLAFQSAPLEFPIDDDAPEIARVEARPAAQPEAPPPPLPKAAERPRKPRAGRKPAVAPAEIDVTGEAARPEAVVLDDGDLAPLCDVLRELGIEVVRVSTRRGGRLPAWRHPSRLLVASARLALSLPLLPIRHGDELVTVAVARDDSQTLSAQVRRLGFRYLLSQPVHPTALRLLFQQVMFAGDNRRRAPRYSMGCRVSWRTGFRREEAVLVEISAEGARAHTSRMPDLGARLRIAIPARAAGGRRLALRGRVVRRERLRESDDEAERFSIGLAWDELGGRTRARLDALLELRAAGPAMLEGAAAGDADLEAPASSAGAVGDRRVSRRGVLEQQIVTIDETQRVQHILMGRDLSARGMRIDPHPDLELGGRLRLALYVSASTDPLELDAEVVRDDGDRGLALAFRHLSPETTARVETLAESLPEVERFVPRPQRVVLGRLMRLPESPPPPA